MKRKVASGIAFALLLVGMLILAFNVQPVRASGTIYIRPNGEIVPSDAPIQKDGDIYTFTDNISDCIVVERDNIVVDGAEYTVQGTGGGRGLDLTYRSNVTVKKATIKSFEIGIQLHDSSNNTLHQNTIASNNNFGIMLWPDSNNNDIIDNAVLNNTGTGIKVLLSNMNRIDGNTIAHNPNGVSLSESYDNNIQNNIIHSNNQAGIYPDFSGENNIIKNRISNNSVGIYTRHSSDSVIGNTIIGNHDGLCLDYSDGNVIYHNNFINNTIQVYSTAVYPLINDWDDGHPSGGNYWSDHAGLDVKSGPYQDQPSSDGIADTQYAIDANNTDYYPLMNPWGAPPPPSYTLTIYSSPTEVTFTVVDVSRATPWSGTYHDGASVSLVIPETHDGYVWSHWLEDGDTNRTKIVAMDTNITLTAVFTQKAEPFPIEIAAVIVGVAVVGAVVLVYLIKFKK